MDYHLNDPDWVAMSVYKNILLLCFETSLNQSLCVFFNVLKGFRSAIIINDSLCDATWTPRGNIVYSTCDYSDEVVRMMFLEADKVNFTRTGTANPRHLSVSNDDVIYLADYEIGVYQSTDDGVSWSLVFKLTDGWNCLKVIKVPTNNSDYFWTLDTKDKSSHRLCVYKTDKKRIDGIVALRDVIVPTTDGKHIDLARSSLSYDDNMNIFLSDCDNTAVHIFSANGQYSCQLLSAHHIKNKPLMLAVDKELQLLFVMHKDNTLSLLKLTHGARV